MCQHLPFLVIHHLFAWGFSKPPALFLLILYSHIIDFPAFAMITGLQRRSNYLKGVYVTWIIRFVLAIYTGSSCEPIEFSRHVDLIVGFIQWSLYSLRLTNPSPGSGIVLTIISLSTSPRSNVLIVRSNSSSKDKDVLLSRLRTPWSRLPTLPDKLSANKHKADW